MGAIRRDGGCRCAAVRFSIDAPPLLTAACHCTGCQRMTGGPFSLSLAVPSASFAVTAGEPVIGGLRRPDLHHFFCPSCMSWLFTRVEGMDWFVNVRTTMLDDPAPFPPFIETWTREKLPYASTVAEHHFAALPSATEFEALVRAFGERTQDAPSPRA